MATETMCQLVEEGIRYSDVDQDMANFIITTLIKDLLGVKEDSDQVE